MSYDCALFNLLACCLIIICVASLHRLCMKEANESSSEEQQASSDEEVYWNANSALLTDLSIPQLDGAADENSGKLNFN